MPDKYLQDDFPDYGSVISEDSLPHAPPVGSTCCPPESKSFIRPRSATPLKNKAGKQVAVMMMMMMMMLLLLLLLMMMMMLLLLLLLLLLMLLLMLIEHFRKLFFSLMTLYD